MAERPDMGAGWILSNYTRPRTGSRLVRVRFRNGAISKNALTAEKWEWRNRRYAYDIEAYKIED